MGEIWSKDMDRGQKIVALARELLSGEMEPDQDIVFRTDKGRRSKWTLCAVALVAALCASCATWGIAQYNGPIGKYDAVELEALTMYISRSRNADESELKRKIENRYGVRDYKELRAKEAAQAKRELETMIP